jgi:hypothetical protein
MNTNWMGGCVLAALAAATLTACAADGAPRPYTRMVFQDAEALTRAAVAATRMGAHPQLHQLPGGQVALVPHQPRRPDLPRLPRR